ncbi:MAG: class I SAM-dependent methyltransferase [Anaerolineae bacterium]|nr:class I SAM-dependent methyltransferase [Anaerolineae bacterium]
MIDRFHKRIAQLIRQTAVTRLLDAGCGEGFGLTHLLNEGLALDYAGCDFSWEALQWGRENLLPGFPVCAADVHRLPFADNSFPLVICLEVLEHLPDSQVGLRELARVSAEYLVLSVPHEPFFRGANFLRGKHMAQWGNDPEHLHNYNGRTFRQMASGVVDILEHGYSFPWQMALARKRI